MILVLQPFFVDSQLERTETESTSPVQTSRHTTVRNEIAAFSAFLYTIRENFSNNEISTNVKHDLRKILAWFIIDVFTHNRDLIAQARKILDLKVQMMTLSLPNNQITSGTLIGLIHYS